MMIHGHFKHPGKIVSDIFVTTTTPRPSTLNPPGKEYICFQTEGKTVWASKSAQ